MQRRNTDFVFVFGALAHGLGHRFKGFRIKLSVTAESRLLNGADDLGREEILEAAVLLQYLHFHPLALVLTQDVDATPPSTNYQ